jgi:RNA polymerase sigma factor (sigma-70 family)
MSIFVNKPDLLRDFREGRRAALEAVYWAYVEIIERILRFGFTRQDSFKVGGVGNAPELRDLVHEVFTRAFAPDARRTYDGIRPYSPYLYAVARHVLADWGRRSGREVPTDEPWIEAALDLEPVVPDEPPAYADERTVAVVERFLLGLPDELKALHEQRSIRGLSQRDAAVALGTTRQHLRTLETRLRDMLREELARAERQERDSQRRPAAERPGG